MNWRAAFTRYAGLRLVDLARRTHTCALMPVLADTEFAAAESLEQLQFEKLKALLLHCQEQVPFYQRWFRQSDFDPAAIRSVDDIDALPVLTKDDIRVHFDEFKARDFARYRPRIKETGGVHGRAAPFVPRRGKS